MKIVDILGKERVRFELHDDSYGTWFFIDQQNEDGYPTGDRALVDANGNNCGDSETIRIALRVMDEYYNNKRLAKEIINDHEKH